MSREPGETVTSFLREFDVAHPDRGRLAAYFTEDAFYHNIPLEPPSPASWRIWVPSSRPGSR